MAQTCAEMIDEVKRRCGRTDDAVLITDDQVTTWFNEAQVDIVDRTPGLHAVTFKNTTSHVSPYAAAIFSICGWSFLHGRHHVRLANMTTSVVSDTPAMISSNSSGDLSTCTLV